MKISLVTLGQFAVLMPLALATLRWRKLPKGTIWVVLLLIAWLLAEIVLYVTRINSTRNLWVLYILTPVQLFILGFFFKALCPTKRILIITLFSVGMVINLVEYFIRPNDLNSISELYQCVLVTITGIAMFYLMAKEEVSFKWSWIVGGITLFFMGSAVYFAAFLVNNNNSLLQVLSDVHSMRLLVTYAILTFGIWKL